MNQFHVDLETLDTAHTSKVLSIGAVFDNDEYYAEVDLEGYPPTAPFTTSEATIEWWEKRGGFKPSVRQVFPFEAVNGLAMWMREVAGGVTDFTVWANSPSFDCAILLHHFAHWDIVPPWKFYQERDVRTAKDLASHLKLGIRIPSNPHNALQDAKNQRDVVTSVYMTLVDRIQLARDCQEMYPGLENGRGN